MAEDSTCVDIWSNGRFDPGVGQGCSYLEFDALCIPCKECSARLREGIELIQKVWTEDKVTFDVRFTQVKDLSLSPKPVQRPMPLWIGARAEKATRSAARLGCHLMATIGPDPAPWYLDELRQCGRNQVNAIAPGVVETGMTAGYFDEPKVMESVRRLHPAGRRAQPKEVAGLIPFLTSPEAHFITGATCPIDGGFLAGKSF